jgi:type II restriction enzyme
MGRSKMRDRVRKIKEMWGEFTFIKVKNTTFQSNLRKIDTVFPKIISQMLLNFFSWQWSRIKDLTSTLEKSQELLSLWLNQNDYEFKIKTFLDAIALWMVPWTEWNWVSMAKGWYIIVKEDGEVICYHLYNRDELRWYLFDNTKFETPSSTKHWFWLLYEDNWELYFNLNLQVRF